MTPTIEKITQEFEKGSLGCCGGEYCKNNHSREFLKSILQACKDYALSVVPEEMGKREDNDLTTWIGYGHPETDMKTGFNYCRKKIIENVNQ